MSWCTFVKAYCNNMMMDKSTTDQKLLLDKFTEDSYTPVDSYKITSEIKVNSRSTSSIGNDVFRDIEMFKNIDESINKTKTVFNVLDFHCTNGGKEITKEILSKPLHNIKILNERQKILKHVNDSIEKTSNIERCTQLESDVLWLFSDIDSNFEDVFNIVFFKTSILKQLNNYGPVLTSWNMYKIIGSPLIGIMSPLVYFIIPYFIMMYKFPQIKMSLMSYLKLMYQVLMNQDLLMGNFGKYKTMRIVSYLFSMLFYFQGIFNSLEISKTIYKMSSFISNKINNVIEFLKYANDIIEVYWDDKIFGNFIETSLLYLSRKEEREYIEKLQIKPFSLISNFGENLKVYKTIDKEVVCSILSKVYIIDSLLSMVKFKNTFNLSFTKFVKHSKPIMQIDGFWHPCLDKKDVIENDFKVGDDCAKSAIITGPNAGGKSTCVKSILINILLSQTLALSTASYCSMTPYHYINSQISIPDCKGHESLFQAELYRCKNNLDIIKSLQPKEYAFITMDEIFNSTNVVEGIAGAYAIANKIANFDNVTLIFTTHFSYLTKLGKDKKKFENFKMNVNVFDSGVIQFPYKLSKGISKQYIALELLKQKGFDSDILDEAISIKNKFVN